MGANQSPEGRSEGKEGRSEGKEGRSEGKEGRSEGKEGLTRQLGVVSAASVVIGMIIGSGIFRVPATVAEQTNSWQWSLAIWTIGGVIAVCGSLCIAELGAMDPRPGG